MRVPVAHRDLQHVPLRALPTYGIFWALLTGARGLILRWFKDNAGKRASALVLLVLGGRTERRRVRADLEVGISERDAGVNCTSQRFGPADVFEGRWPVVNRDRRMALPLSSCMGPLLGKSAAA